MQFTLCRGNECSSISSVVLIIELNSTKISSKLQQKDERLINNFRYAANAAMRPYVICHYLETIQISWPWRPCWMIAGASTKQRPFHSFAWYFYSLYINKLFQFYAKGTVFIHFFDILITFEVLDDVVEFFQWQLKVKRSPF